MLGLNYAGINSGKNPSDGREFGVDNTMSGRELAVST